MATTGENVVVTWANAQSTLDAWREAEYYATGSAESLLNAFGGNGDSLDVDTVPDREANRDDFCEKLRYYYGAWSEAELALLEARSHLAPGTIRGELRAAGFKRTANAVALKLRQRGWRREKAEGRYTKATLQACFGVSGATLSRWADRCGLKVERERPMLAPRGAEPHAGAEWSVRERHLKAFVVDNVAIIDFRKVDKFWLVDLLAARTWESKGDEE